MYNHNMNSKRDIIVNKNIFFYLTLVLIVSSCSSLGSKMNTGNIFTSSDNIKSNIIPITPEVILELNEENEQNLPFNSNKNIEHQKYYNYKVGPGDVLNVTVWDHPELTIPAGQFRSAGESGNVIRADGTIFYPYVGLIKVSGLDVAEIRNLLLENLSKYIENPQIDVSVASYNSQKVFVSGSVVMPSALPITNIPLTIMDAISASGGLEDYADWRSVTLTRTTNQNVTKETIDLYELLEKGNMNQNRLLISGDVINVPRNDSLKVFVIKHS